MTKLVIIDDHEALREGLAALLGHGGMEVVGAAGNVAAGVDLVEHTHPDVAIVDIRLPDGSGIDLTRELLARRPDLGVILYTGDSDAELLYDGLDSGARGYALKAGSMDELLAAIERVKGRPALGALELGAVVDRLAEQIEDPPSVSSPTGTVIGLPVSTTGSPRLRPSVASMATARRRSSPRCCCTSQIRVVFSTSPSPPISISSAE